MKYKDIEWNLMINDEQAEPNDNGLDFIAEEIQRGNTSGMFTIDCTDYDKVEELKQELEQELGREVNFNVEDDDKGELNELKEIAQKNDDNYVVELIDQILEYGFDG